MASQSNPSLTNVKSSFDAIKKDGSTSILIGGPDYKRLSTSHLQGMAVYHDVYILAMNRHSEDLGELYFYDRIGNGLIGMMKIPVAGNDTGDHERSYNHPGGIQVIGDYLLIPIQTQDYKDSVVQLWDISALKEKSTAIKLAHGDYLPDSNGKGLGGIGIVNMGDHFLVAGIDNARVFFYKSDGSEITTATYAHAFDATLARDAAAVNLLRQTDGTAWLIAFAVSTWFGSYKDWGLLYKIDPTEEKIADKDERHFVSKADSSTILGPHFRWGATSWFPTETTLRLMTTQRVMEPKVQLETWKA